MASPGQRPVHGHRPHRHRGRRHRREHPVLPRRARHEGGRCVGQLRHRAGAPEQRLRRAPAHHRAAVRRRPRRGTARVPDAAHRSADSGRLDRGRSLVLADQHDQPLCCSVGKGRRRRRLSQRIDRRDARSIPRCSALPAASSSAIPTATPCNSSTTPLPHPDTSHERTGIATQHRHRRRRLRRHRTGAPPRTTSAFRLAGDAAEPGQLRHLQPAAAGSGRRVGAARPRRRAAATDGQTRARAHGHRQRHRSGGEDRLVPRRRRRRDALRPARARVRAAGESVDRQRSCRVTRCR